MRIERIYNRVIFDELIRRPDLDAGVSIPGGSRCEMGRTSELVFSDQQTFAPVSEDGAHRPAFFADEFPEDESIENYVLKPLYSFAGLGVDMEPTREKLAPWKNRTNGFCRRKSPTRSLSRPSMGENRRRKSG